MKKLKSLSLFPNLWIEGRKYLLVVPFKELENFEKRYNIYLGTKRKNKLRPALFWRDSFKEDSPIKLIFFTSSKVSPVKVDLSLCISKSKLCQKFSFDPVSFVFQDKEGRYLCFKLKTVELIEKAYFCGSCEDLEFLDKLNYREI
ncbi:MAG: hypothetical protein RMI63_08420 [Caldimicrobium sp.]|nr:hypothetical protein [Caldimicrobium sp.]